MALLIKKPGSPQLSRSAIQETVTVGVLGGILDGLLASASLIMIWLYSPALALTAIVALSMLIFIQAATYSSMKRLSNESLVADARISSTFLESIRGIRSLKLAGRVEQRRMAWQSLIVESINLGIRTQWLGITIGAASTLISGSQSIIRVG